jgi:hypothetical protein
MLLIAIYKHYKFVTSINSTSLSSTQLRSQEIKHFHSVIGPNESSVAIERLLLPPMVVSSFQGLKF